MTAPTTDVEGRDLAWWRSVIVVAADHVECGDCEAKLREAADEIQAEIDDHDIMYEQKCPKCSGHLEPRGEGAQCEDCGGLCSPCWEPGCRGFFRQKGFDGEGMAQLECNECGKETEIFCRFAPDASA